MPGKGASVAIDLVKLDGPAKDVAGFAALHVDERDRPLMASPRLLTPLPAIVIYAGRRNGRSWSAWGVATSMSMSDGLWNLDWIELGAAPSLRWRRNHENLARPVE